MTAQTRQRAVTTTVRELERHVAAAGWDGPLRVFALVRTAGALERDRDLAGRLPADVVAAARQDPEHLTAVEQDGLPEAATVEDVLARLAWPPSVDGAAVVVERSVLPPEAEAGLPDDEAEAVEWLQRHPRREDVRLAVAVLRDGVHACALRARSHDADDRVAVEPNLAPGLVSAVAATLVDG
jgi:sulfur carrier protein ThiS